MGDLKRREDDKVIDIVLYEVRENRKKIGEIAEDVAALNVRTGFIGFIAGMIPASVTMVWMWIKSGKG